MRFMDRIEGFLEGLMEGVFGRGPEDLPACILHRAAAALEEMAAGEGGGRWAPSEYHVILTREAMRAILPIRAELEEELQNALARLAARAGLVFPGPLRFRFGVGDGGGAALLSVRASFSPPPPEGGGGTPAAMASLATSPTKVYRRPGALRERAWLRVESGPDAGREFQLIEGEMIVGRELAAHVALGDPNVSRRHAKIAFRRGEYFLTDLGSTNGTTVNGKAVRRHRLRDGDLIRVGRTAMVFHFEE